MSIYKTLGVTLVAIQTGWPSKLMTPYSGKIIFSNVVCSWCARGDDVYPACIVPRPGLHEKWENTCVEYLRGKYLMTT